MGPSGCGKSTLLNTIAGHLVNEFSYQGEIWLAGKQLNPVPVHKRQIGMLFQQDLLFPHLSVWENLAFALPHQVRAKERRAKALSALDEIELLPLANRYPWQLSGGQRARISLVRMLLARPKLVLLDEPFSQLDHSLRGQFRDWVFARLKEAQTPSLLVTHDRQDIPPSSQLVEWSQLC